MKQRSPLSRRKFLRSATLTAAAGACGLEGGAAALDAAEQQAASPLSAREAELPLGPPETVARRNGIPYRAFGSTGENVSILGLGGYHVGVPPSADEAVRLIRRAIDEGINFLDNAWEYHRGMSEVRFGRALTDGYRDRVFLMTKVCARDRAGAMRQLEESLERMKTDRIDLWQFHEVNYDNDPEWIFADDGAIHAALEARKQGKIRFIGFTGHKSPHIHLEMLRRDFAWDAVQMPLNVMDAHYRSFARSVLPVLVERGIAAIGMKPLGGNGSIPEKGGVTVRECLEYAWSLKIPVCLSGMQNEKLLLENIGHARSFEAKSAAAIVAVLDKVREAAGDGRYERFKSTQDFDSGVHRAQHGLG